MRAYNAIEPQKQRQFQDFSVDIWPPGQHAERLHSRTGIGSQMGSSMYHNFAMIRRCGWVAPVPQRIADPRGRRLVVT